MLISPLLYNSLLTNTHYNLFLYITSLTYKRTQSEVRPRYSYLAYSWKVGRVMA
jgi:hypothetical protein